MLLPCGAIVIEAGSGADGIEQVRHAKEAGRPVRLLIADHLMPGMDGFEMISQIREFSSDRELSVMMLSSADLPQSLARVRELGIEWYVVKPVKRAELYAAIAHAMNEGAPAHITSITTPPRTVNGPDPIVQRPLRILLADDSDDNRLLIQAYLRKTPYQLDEAEDGEKALDLIFHRTYDVVLMDIQMPVMDGYTAVEKIREWEQRTHRARTPIIALTASALDDAVRHTRAVGFDMHVSKPVKRVTLLNAIAKSCADGAAQE
jgi:CheY-like chemotaxis protein